MSVTLRTLLVSETLASNAVWLVNCDLWSIWYEAIFACIGVPHNLEFSAGTEEIHDRPHDSLSQQSWKPYTSHTEFSSVIAWMNLLSYHCWNSDIPVPFILIYTVQDACNMKVLCSCFCAEVMANARVLLQIAVRWDFPYMASVSCFMACHALYKVDVASGEIPELAFPKVCFWFLIKHLFVFTLYAYEMRYMTVLSLWCVGRLVVVKS